MVRAALHKVYWNTSTGCKDDLDSGICGAYKTARCLPPFSSKTTLLKKRINKTIIPLGNAIPRKWSSFVYFKISHPINL